jgi:hypothetical protein
VYALALAASVAVLPVLGWSAGGATSLEELVSQMANTPDEHKAVADYFRSRAEQARAEANVHKRMGKNYGGTKIAAAAQMKQHCEQIAEAQETVAKQYEELAQLHDAEAKGAKPSKP